jgi:SAM-dependent methyltransferase
MDRDNPLSLCWLFWKVKRFLWKEAREVRRCFPAFMGCERAFKRAYRFQNPFRMCRRFSEQRGEERVDAYGETPLPVYAQIARMAHLSQSDTVIEMGCGRGRGVFFLSHLLGCRVVGIDWVPAFIQNALAVARSLVPSLPVSFQCEEMQYADLSRATAVYLYGTCLSDAQIAALIPRFEKMDAAARIITVSYPLSDYSSRFHTIAQCTALFPWGDAEVYVSAFKTSLDKERIC